MKEFLGKKYISEKEASNKYGYSVSWFQKGRINGNGPNFFQLRSKGRVLYDIEELDKWFKENLIEIKP